MMQPARFIARLIGPAYLAVGIGILLNGSFYSGLVAEAVKSPTLIYFSGLLALVSGLAILNVHRSWSGWPVLITIIGWLLVIGGAVRLVLPATTRRSPATFIPSRRPCWSLPPSCSSSALSSRWRVIARRRNDRRPEAGRCEGVCSRVDTKRKRVEK